MKESTKKARQNKKIAELLGLDVKEVEALRSKDEADDVMREAQQKRLVARVRVHRVHVAVVGEAERLGIDRPRHHEQSDRGGRED